MDPYGDIQTSGDPRILSDALRFIAQPIARLAVQRVASATTLAQAAGEVMVTMSSAPRLTAMRATTGWSARLRRLA
jgi:hypothetical protein